MYSINRTITELRRVENSLKKLEGFFKKIDYNYKSIIISQNLDNLVSSLEYRKYINNLYSSLDSYFSLKRDNDIILNKLLDKYGFSAYLEGYRVYNAKIHRVSRLRKRVGDIIKDNSLFLTLTFRDDVLNSTSSVTRRRYVQRFLKSYSNNYVGNIDFGSRNGREHYHAVIQCHNINPRDWNYGLINFEKIRLNNYADVKLSKYISKLVNHAIKETTKRNTLLYSKRN